jgi:hypothetical protein
MTIDSLPGHVRHFPCSKARSRARTPRPALLPLLAALVLLTGPFAVRAQPRDASPTLDGRG